MQKEKKGLPLVFGILAFIVGAALYREFDFETFRFKKVGLGIVYLITFVGMVIAIVQSRRNKG
jgi:TRAP-type C4-dicarboxylate transport system permease small subunit